MYLHYRLFPVIAASLTLLVTGLIAGCGSEPPPQTAQAWPATAAPKAASSDPDGMDTEATIFTVLGLAKRESEAYKGPHVGNQVSPVLWEAAHDTLDFAGISSEDPMTGLLMTRWYSPPTKPTQRLRVTVFILSRALRSDSIALNVEREERSPTGQWQASTVDREVVSNLETAILQRARQLHAERYRSNM